MAEYKYYYFGVYARGEVIRLLLNHAKVQFEDIRISMQDWPNFKSQMPSGQVPVLETKTGQKLNQTNSIVRYLGKLYGYYPTESLDAYEVDRIVDAYMDIFGNLYKPVFVGPEAKEAAIETVFKSLPGFLDFIEPYCAKGSWLVGSKLSVADFWVGGLYTNNFNNPLIYAKDKYDELLAKYPAFKAYGERFAAENSTYLAVRPPAPV